MTPTLSIDLSVINQNEYQTQSQTESQTESEMFDFSDEPVLYMPKIAIPKLERQWTLDKLMGPFSENFLQRVPSAIPAAIQARKSYLLKCLFQLLDKLR